MRGLIVVGWAFVGAIVIGIVVATMPWLTAGHVPSVDERLFQTSIATEDPQADEPACAYCRPLDELRSAFVRRVEASQQRVATLKDSLSSRDEAGGLGTAIAATGSPIATIEDDLAAGERSLSASLAAVERIDVWRKHCRSQAICRPAQTAPVVSLSLKTRCDVMTDPVVGHIQEVKTLSDQVTAIGADCEGKSCPATDCTKNADLRRALTKAASGLDLLAGPGVAATSSQSPNDARRSAEIRDIAQKTSEEIRYTSRLFPMMFNDLAETSAADILAMANARLASRVDILAKATTGQLPNGPADSELIWRLKLISVDVASLRTWSSSNITYLRSDSAMVEHWGRLADDLGAALLHAAGLDLLLQAPTDAKASVPCSASRIAADAAAAAKAALAAISVCARRSKCSSEEPSIDEPIDAPSAVELFTQGLAEGRAAAAQVSVSQSSSARGDERCTLQHSSASAPLAMPY